MYVIAGVTGNTGSVVAQTLLDAGHPVRVIVRSADKGTIWKDKGAEVAIADLFDKDAVRTALTGATAAYLLLPPELGREDFLSSRRDLAETLVQAVEESNIAHTVFLSSVAAQHDDKTGPIRTLAYLERLLEKSPAVTTALRPGYFLDNWGAVLPVVQNDSILPSFLHPLDRSIDMVATGDIGKTAADLLLAPAPQDNHRVVELKGKAQYAPQDIAASLSRVLEREITPVAVPSENWAGILQNAGMASSVIDLFVEMYDGINNGFITYENRDVRYGETELDTFFARLLQ